MATQFDEPFLGKSALVPHGTELCLIGPKIFKALTAFLMAGFLLPSTLQVQAFAVQPILPPVFISQETAFAQPIVSAQPIELEDLIINDSVVQGQRDSTDGGTIFLSPLAQIQKPATDDETNQSDKSSKPTAPSAPLISPSIAVPTLPPEGSVPGFSGSSQTLPSKEMSSGENVPAIIDYVKARRSPNTPLQGPLKPFLLHSQDATITYLMPGAITQRPDLGLALRTILESRALAFWQQARAQQTFVSDKSKENRQPYFLRSQIEDRFQSPRFSSLYWSEEEHSSKDRPSRSTNHTLNYDHQSKQIFGLAEMFSAKDSQTLDGLLQLLSAYIRVDIARQKSIRLGATVSPDQDAWLKDFSPTAGQLASFNLEPSVETGKIAGLTFHFDNGLLGAEADGPYMVYVPASIFSTALGAEFADQFGGELIRASSHSARSLSSAKLHLLGMKSGAELGGTMTIEGEVPQNWCNGLHVTLTDGEEIVAEGQVELEPDLPTFGLVDNMLRFRADITVNGEGGKEGFLTFEPYGTELEGTQAPLKAGHACDLKKTLVLPNPSIDQIAIPVTY
ncbi:MAG: hypothetical protein N4A65_03695 [Cohaesibacter sp.]|jgi:hypothetical protein|nr:hypothetical protein [Cohaesibacter sp.]